MTHDERGVISRATVEVSGTEAEFVTAIGQALGLARSTDTVNSVMSATTRTTPGPADLVTLRALSGAPAW